MSSVRVLIAKMITPSAAMRMGALVSALLFSACSPSTNSVTAPTANPEQGTDSASVMIDSVNYRHDREIKYELYAPEQNANRPVGGAIVSQLASGGDKGCCLNLPSQWRPGLKVRVTWGEATQEILPERYERTLDIPRYKQPSDLYVVFYPEHEVEVVVSVGEPGHPDWAGRIKQTPWDYCVAQHGRKPCKAALPKQFDINESRGFCTYTKSSDFPSENFDPEALCLTAMQQCITDYEDEQLCRDVLYGSRKP